MSANLEVKGNLARLLATEDLLVEHKNVSTASFNVHSRVLTLPRWEKASNNVLNLLVSHEVAHALFTPDEDWRKKTNVPQGFINVTEDVRIEVLMKKKYAGLPKTFFRGYQELHDKDFFGLDGLDVSEMNIADRVNLHFKIGNFIKVPFTDEEMVVVRQCADAVTFDDAIAAAEALYALHQKQKEEQQQQQEEVSSSADGEGEPQSSEEGESDQTEEGQGDGEDEEGEGEGEEGGSNQSGSEDGEDGEQPDFEPENGGGGERGGDMSDEVSTMENFNENLEEMSETSGFNEPIYVSYPKIDSNVVVASNSDVHSHIHKSWDLYTQRIRDNDEKNGYSPEVSEETISKIFSPYERMYQEFSRNVQPEVNYMVKEFECKKSAAAYARASTSRTGVLDCTKLHTYKYNEDLFKKVTTLPQGKNHGLVFVLDWSGSMCYVLEDTLKQLISILMFCDKVNIPFEVYAFTNEWNVREGYSQSYDHAGEFVVGGEFSMMNILTSKVGRKELKRQMQTIYTLAASYKNAGGHIVPGRVGLSGTPLNEALISLRQLLPEFKEKNGVEKAHVMVLTDGDAGWTKYTTEYESYDGEVLIRPTRMSGRNVYVRNKATGSVTKVDYAQLGGITKTILGDLREQFPESTFTGFRILERGSSWYIRQATNYDSDLIAKWKKEKSLALTNAGYDKYYVMAADSVQGDSNFAVDEGATKAKIKSAFVKSLKSKKNNKKILGDFIGLIA